MQKHLSQSQSGMLSKSASYHNEIFESLLGSASHEHGHLCPGQVVGVRMAFLGLKLIGFSIPVQNKEIKHLLVYIEMDRCAGDAVAHVTKVRLGRRSLKFKDYGIMAATFVNLATGKSYRVVSKEKSRELAERYFSSDHSRMNNQISAYKILNDNEMFDVYEVCIDISEYDMPGPTRKRVICDKCGQTVRDNRHIATEGKNLCRICTAESYILSQRKISLFE